eukprot:m.132819 g.132819  ORF g.132819 m.132819 type:complete len:53 (+) comp17511_c0_seq3:1937-2095(+)
MTVAAIRIEIVITTKDALDWFLAANEYEIPVQCPTAGHNLSIQSIFASIVMR